MWRLGERSHSPSLSRPIALGSSSVRAATASDLPSGHVKHARLTLPPRVAGTVRDDRRWLAWRIGQRLAVRADGPGVPAAPAPLLVRQLLEDQRAAAAAGTRNVDEVHGRMVGWGDGAALGGCVA